MLIVKKITDFCDECRITVKLIYRRVYYVKKTSKGFIILAIMCFFVINEQKQIFAQEALNDLCNVYDSALNAVAAMSEDMEVAIGNVYNIIDEDGDLEGYSLGYFVNDIPYGYAIYSIENACIREFVFNENIENLYLQMADCFNDNNMEIADGLVSNSVVDYSVVDTNGLVVTNEGEEKQISLKKAENQIDSINLYNEELFQENNEVDYGSTIHDVYYYSEGSEYGNIPALDKQTYSEVPNCGLSMFGQTYILNVAGRYCCAISASTGVINWAGLLKDNSVKGYI